jgi:hypothetical protein
MNDAHPLIDYAKLPAPSEGIVVTTFITVRSIARSRAFYRDVLEGTVLLEENPCMVKLANSWIIRTPQRLTADMRSATGHRDTSHNCCRTRSQKHQVVRALVVDRREWL